MADSMYNAELEEVTLARKNWVHGLSSGEYHKVIGVFTHPNADVKNACALGVLAQSNDLDIRAFDESGLSLFSKLLSTVDMPVKVGDYVIAMNDGEDTFVVGRRNTIERSHKFIARWLEIYFALLER